MVAGQLSKGNPAQNVLTQLVSSPPTTLPEGYVDQSGIIKEIPASVQPGLLLPFPDEASASQALAEGKISGLLRHPLRLYPVRKDHLCSFGFQPARLFR